MKYFLSFLESGRETFGEPPYVVQQQDDGFVQIVSADNAAYVAWLAEGNEPQEWQSETDGE